jgi:hypothetical protein
MSPIEVENARHGSAGVSALPAQPPAACSRNVPIALSSPDADTCSSPRIALALVSAVKRRRRRPGYDYFRTIFERAMRIGCAFYRCPLRR